MEGRAGRFPSEMEGMVRGFVVGTSRPEMDGREGSPAVLASSAASGTAGGEPWSHLDPQMILLLARALLPHPLPRPLPPVKTPRRMKPSLRGCREIWDP
ncbi:hypothetical protein VPH35_133297 [Triticum aestivum]